MGTHSRRHARGIREEARKGLAPGAQDRVLGIGGVHGHPAAVGVHGRHHGSAHVVDLLLADLDLLGVRERVARGVAVRHELDASSDHGHLGTVLPVQERRQRAQAVPDVTVQHQARVAGERLRQQHVELAEAERERRPPEAIGKGDAAASVVVVALLGRVPLQRPLDLGALGPHDRPGGRFGGLDAVVDAWLDHPRRRPPLLEPRGQELRLARPVDSARVRGHEPVAVGVREVVVRPGSPRRLQPAQVELPLGDEHRPWLSVVAVAVDRDVREVVVRADRAVAGRSAAGGRRCPRAGCS